MSTLRTTLGILAGVLAVAVWATGCGSSPPPQPDPPKPSAGEDPPSSRSGLTIDSEIGALDEGEVRAVFQRATPKLVGCFQKGSERLPYLFGAVSFAVRVDGEGRALHAYLKDSTLGDRATEDCMLSVLKAERWPRPQGGREGIAGNENMTFDPGTDERPPVDWSEGQLGSALTKAKSELSRCKNDAGTAGLKATLYVDTDGKAKSVGVSTADEKGEAAVRCVVEALGGLTYPSPGSWAAKVSISSD